MRFPFAAILVCLLAVGTAQSAPAPAESPANSPAVNAPAPALRSAYELGYALYAPIAQVQYLDHEVQGLAVYLSRPLTPENKADELTKIDRLDQLASHTRQIELQSVTTAVGLMQRMGVPQSMRAPYEQAQAALSKPLVLAKDTRKLEKSEPATARILSTMEEADALLPTDTGVLPDWISLARGQSADWSFHVGTLEASLAVASDTNEPAIALLQTAPALAARAPADAPGDVRPALVSLVKEIQTHGDTTQKLLSDTAVALHKAFEGQ